MNLADLSPRPVADGVDPQTFADEVTAAARSSFSLGMKLMGRERRQAMRAVYAFCRVVDDIADGDPPADTLNSDQKRAMLADWRAEIDRLYDGAPVSAIGQALRGPVRRYDLPRAEFIAMIEGMETDADGPVVAPSMEALRTYTRRVAGSVGMLSLRIFGAWRGADSDQLAVSLADAIQLTNILRDVEEDAGIGRLYLPREILTAIGLPLTPEGAASHPDLPRACAALGQVARAEFETAAAQLARHPRIPSAPARAMMGVYRRYLDLMQAADWQRPAPTMGRWEKMRHGLGAVLAGR